MCVSVTKLAATYLINFASPKCSYIKFLTGAPNALYCMDFAKNALFSTFVDAKFLDFLPAGGSMTLHINRTLCIARYI